LMIAVGISVLPRYARLVRASAMSLRDLEFIEAARAAGASIFRVHDVAPVRQAMTIHDAIAAAKR